MSSILGISAFYHDSAAALVVDGEIVAAAQEERFTRKKHDPGSRRTRSHTASRRRAQPSPTLDYVAFYEKPLRKFERLLETYLAFAPIGLPELPHGDAGVAQGEAAPAGASFARDWAATSQGAARLHRSSREPRRQRVLPEPVRRGRDSHARRRRRVEHDHDGRRARQQDRADAAAAVSAFAGLLYSAFTYYCGFKVNSGEYKLMGLAPYGQPIYKDLIHKHLIDLKPDGSFWLDMQYFNYCQGLTMTTAGFDELFGGPPRDPESDDRAAAHGPGREHPGGDRGGHAARWAASCHAQTGMKKLVLAGGVALNCVANGRLLREGPFEDIWIQPAAGDAGGALGAALFVWHQLLDKPRTAGARATARRAASSGRASRTADICGLLDGAGAQVPALDERSRAAATRSSDLLADGKIVGWFQGRMEFGPRALGARSILGDPAVAEDAGDDEPEDQVPRELPAVRADRAAGARRHEWFELEPGQESPYMLLVAPVLEQHRVPITDAAARRRWRAIPTCATA